jgi:hypothetical protein
VAENAKLTPNPPNLPFPSVEFCSQFEIDVRLVADVTRTTLPDPSGFAKAVAGNLHGIPTRRKPSSGALSGNNIIFIIPAILHDAFRVMYATLLSH